MTNEELAKAKELETGIENATSALKTLEEINAHVHLRGENIRGDFHLSVNLPDEFAWFVKSLTKQYWQNQKRKLEEELAAL